MKLRRGFPLQQLLFIALTFVVLLACGFAQDMVTMRDGRVSNAEVMGVVDDIVEVKVGAGSIGIPLSKIARIEKVEPPTFTAAVKAYEGGDLKAALAGARAVSAKFAGLPTAWAQQAVSMVGEIYLQQGDIERAGAAFKAFKEKYPEQRALQGNVGMARLAVAGKDWDKAKSLVTPVTEAALKDKTPTKSNGLAYGQAFYVLAQIKQHEGDLQGALQDYLRTVTIFHQDSIASSEAQNNAEELRREHPEIVVP